MNSKGRRNIENENAKMFKSLIRVTEISSPTVEPFTSSTVSIAMLNLIQVYGKLNFHRHDSILMIQLLMSDMLREIKIKTPKMNEIERETRCTNNLHIQGNIPMQEELIQLHPSQPSHFCYHPITQ